MNNYTQIDETIADKLNEIGCRLYSLKYCLKFYLYCIENNIIADSDLELACFGTILYDFFNTTKTKYNELESELKI